VAHFKPVVAVESAVSTVSFAPTAKRDGVLAAEAEINDPFAVGFTRFIVPFVSFMSDAENTSPSA
jgi:hypothetical protein